MSRRNVGHASVVVSGPCDVTTCHNASARHRCSCFRATSAESTTHSLLPCLRCAAGSDGVPLVAAAATAPALRAARAAAQPASAAAPQLVTTSAEYHRVRNLLPARTLRTVAASLQPGRPSHPTLDDDPPPTPAHNLTPPTSPPSLGDHPCPLSAPGYSCKRRMAAPLGADAPLSCLQHV